MKTRVIVSAVIRKHDKPLFGKKASNIGPYPNTWHLLGGGVNEGEEFEDALKREVKEEAGIEIRNIKRISKEEDDEPNKNGELTHYIFHVFSADYDSGELMPNDDIVSLKWISGTELKNISLTRPTIKLFKKLKII